MCKRLTLSEKVHWKKMVVIAGLTRNLYAKTLCDGTYSNPVLARRLRVVARNDTFFF